MADSKYAGTIADIPDTAYFAAAGKRYTEFAVNQVQQKIIEELDKQIRDTGNDLLPQFLDKEEKELDEVVKMKINRIKQLMHDAAVGEKNTGLIDSILKDGRGWGEAKMTNLEAMNRGKVSYEYGRFIEEDLLNATGTGGNPAADLGNIETEIKGTAGGGASTLAVGRITIGGIVVPETETEAELKERFRNIQYKQAAALFKLVKKMKNLLYIRLKRAEGPVHPQAKVRLEFRAMILFLDIIVKKVYELIMNPKKTASGYQMQTITADASSGGAPQKTKVIMPDGSVRWEASQVYIINIHHVPGTDVKSEIANIQILAELYRRRFDLFNEIQGNKVARNAFFREVKDTDYGWFEVTGGAATGRPS